MSNRFDPSFPIILSGEVQPPIVNDKKVEVIDKDDKNPLISFINNPSLQCENTEDGPKTSSLPIIW